MIQLGLRNLEVRHNQQQFEELARLFASFSRYLQAIRSPFKKLFVWRHLPGCYSTSSLAWLLALSCYT